MKMKQLIEKIKNVLKKNKILCKIVSDVKGIPQKILAFPRRLVLFICRLYYRFFSREDLAHYVYDLQSSLLKSVDQRRRLIKLLDQPINYLDVGARHGVPKYLKNYSECFNFFLCEPEPEEARRLEKRGYRVIDKALSDREGEAILYITKKPGGSS